MLLTRYVMLPHLPWQPLCAEATIHFLLCACSPNYTIAVNDEHSTWRDVNVGANVLLNDFDVEGNAQISEPSWIRPHWRL